MELKNFFKPQNWKTFVSVSALLIILFAIPTTVYLSLNSRQIQVPAASELKCAEVGATKFGKLPNKSQSEDKVKSLAKKTKELKDENSKFFFLKSDKKVAQFAQERASLLSEAIQQCPDKARKLILSSKERETIKKIAPKYVEEERAFEGSLEVTHVDFTNGTSETQYSLKTSDNKNINLKFSEDSHVYLESRTKVKVRGALVNNNLLIDGSFPAVKETGINGGIDVVSQPGNPPVLGDQRMPFVSIQFNNLEAMPIDPLNTSMASTIPTFFSQVSYSKTRAVPVSLGVVTLPVAGTCDYGTIRSNTIQAIDPTVDFRTVDRLVIYGNFNGCGWDGLTQFGKSNLTTGEGVLPFSVALVNANNPTPRVEVSTFHEVGHNFGFDHGQFWKCPIDNTSTSCNEEYGDDGTVLGNVSNSREYSAPHRELAGWFAPNNITNVTSSGTYTIQNIESTTGEAQILKIPRASGGFLYIEYRQPINSDQNLPVGYQGTLIHTLASDQMHSILHDSKQQNDKTNPLLAVGNTFNDSSGKVTVTTLATNAASSLISVTLNSTNPGGNNGGTPPPPPTPGQLAPFTNVDVTWSRPAGYAVGSSTRKSIDWGDVSYSVDVRCSTGFATACGSNSAWNTFTSCGSWPQGSCPPYIVTRNSVQILTTAGFGYEYRVWLVTKKDGDPSRTASYMWKDATAVPSCSSGTCTKTLSWNKASYKAYLQRDNGSRACDSSVGCSDGTFADTSSATFLGVPQNINFKAVVNIEDKNGATHLLQNLTGLGAAETYSRSCSSASANSCKMPGYPDANAFIGNQPVSLTVRANSVSGPVISGPTWVTAASDGSLTASWNWSYSYAIFPASNANCYVVIADCKTAGPFTDNNSTYSYSIAGVKPNIQYRRIVCAPDCGGGIVLSDSTVTSGTPAGAGLQTPTVTCTGTRVNINFKWSAATGATYDLAYLDVGTWPGAFNYGNYNVTGKSSLDVAADVNTKYYWRVNSRLRDSLGGQFWNSSSGAEIQTIPSCSGRNLPSVDSQYFDNADFTNLKMTRTDNTIDFDWGTGSPDTSIGPDTFSVRFNTLSTLDKSVYRYILKADDNAKVYLDNSPVPLISTSVSNIPYAAALDMAAGVHTIRVDYIENTATAKIKLKFFKTSFCNDLDGDGAITSLDLTLVANNMNARGVTPGMLTTIA